jgi:hypothetical protein
VVSFRREFVVLQHRRRPADAYWCLRLCEVIKPTDDKGDTALWTKALARVVSYDPTWFVNLSLSGAGVLGVLQASPPVLVRVEKLISIQDRSLGHYVKGLRWALALRYATRSVERLRHAANHLLRVDERHRTDRYYEDVCHALEHVDYDKMKTFFPQLVGLSPTGFAEGDPRASAIVLRARLVFALVAAARAGDWETYDAYRERYEGGEDPHWDCKIMNNDGLRELARDRDEHLAEILEYLTKRAANVKFMGVEDDTSFVETLIRAVVFSKSVVPTSKWFARAPARFLNGSTCCLLDLSAIVLAFRSDVDSLASRGRERRDQRRVPSGSRRKPSQRGEKAHHRPSSMEPRTRSVRPGSSSLRMSTSI